MTASMPSTRSAALAVVLLAAAPAWAEPPASDQQGSRPKSHHSHRSHKHEPTADAAAAPTPEPAPLSPSESGAAAASAANSATPAETSAPKRGVSTEAQSELKQSRNTEHPWVKAPPAEKTVALDLFHEGNGLLKESLFVQATAKYREALRHWDHPGIHYNLALALLNLDQPVEVYTQLEEALKYGAQPLDSDKFDHAVNYRALIGKQLARVDIECQRDGAVVTFDGQKVLTAPGRYEGLVRAGQHTVVGEKSGYLTAQKTPTLVAGEKTTIVVNLYSVDDLTRYKRRFANWLPYTTIGAGLVVGGIGGILYWQADESFKRYSAGIESCSSARHNEGCIPSSSLTNKKTMGRSEQYSAFTLWGVGGAAVLSGVVLVVMNRPRMFRINPESEKLSLTPVIGLGSAGLTASLKF